MEWRMCQNDNNPTKEQKTVKGPQWVFITQPENPKHLDRNGNGYF